MYAFSSSQEAKLDIVAAIAYLFWILYFDCTFLMAF